MGLSHKHKTVFYIALAWEITVTFTSLIVLILKCGVSACRRKTWIPVTVFIVCVAVSTVCFLTDTPAFKIPELLCFTCIVMIESCIAIGLIPSNDEYENYFYRSAYSAVITDENLSVIYDSEKSIFTDKNLLGRAAKSPVMIDENTRLSAEKIHGGYTFRIEDLSKVNEINAALSETNERLSEENYIIEAENELKEQKAQIAEQNKLYAKMDEVTCEELKRLDALLSDMYHKTQLNSTEYIDKMRFACILAAYIKRRSNLVMLAEKQENIDVGKLLLATKRRLAEPLDKTEQKQMICFWQAEIAALKSTRPHTKKDNLQVIKDAAKLVGVTVEFCGEQPKADTVNEKILIAAMHECLTNTVSHANGKTMTVTATYQNGKYTIAIKNDGEKPKGEIIEGGGLSGLRLLVERENGTMVIHGTPQFELIIELPQGEKI